MDARGIKCDPRVWNRVVFEIQQNNLNLQLLFEATLLLQTLESMTFQQILALPNIGLTDGQPGKVLQAQAQYPRVLIDIRGVIRRRAYVHAIELTPVVVQQI